MKVEKVYNGTCVLYAFADLAPFGIHPLTGEACAFSQRTLCDVNEEGQELLADFLGVPDLRLPPAMNLRVNGEPAVGSIMLESTSWKALARFALVREGVLGYVEHEDGSLLGIFDLKLMDQYIESGFPVRRNYALVGTAPRVCSRNVHAMTGRVV